MAFAWHREGMIEPRTDIVIRRADASDARALLRLAALDSAEVPPAGPEVLLAEVAGQIVAAVHDGRAIADPFRHTAGIVDLLDMRARQLTPAATPRQPRRRRALLRPAPHPLA